MNLTKKQIKEELKGLNLFGYTLSHIKNELYYFQNKFYPALFLYKVCKKENIEFTLKYGFGSLTDKEIEKHNKEFKK